ncbi:MAG: HAMP domain-containing protein [Desulfosarcina sp.]|nr:HAMP domain-containing protein [Desulfosarcina sp.]MBC2742389.1 HAMP domain-containing protein [Desulfosarcina sp.]MBC2765299.1 HAMP domain-containing protein [Desulfosarcina sp.]
MADKTAQQIDNFFRTSQKDINLLADYPFVQLAFLQYEFRQRLDTVQRLLLDYSKKNDYFSRIYLIALDGQPILAVPSTDLTRHNFSEDHWFSQTLQKGVYLSDALSPKSYGQAGIFLGKVIYDFEDASQPVGVLAFHIKASAYTDFARSLHIGSGGYALLMHHGGKMIHHPDRQFRSTRDIIKNSDDRLQIHIHQMTQGKKGYGHYSFLEEEKFLVYTPCRERPWSVGITILQAELMADINRFQKKMLTFFLVIIILILPISYLFIKGLTRPIKQLIEGASRIGSGDLNQTIHIESNDELRDVAEEFNKMAVQLKSSMNEIIDLKNFNDDILRNVTSGIITVDRKGRITSFNASAAKILDHTPHPASSHQLDAIPEHLYQILEALKQTLEAGLSIHHRELAVSKSDQELSYVEINTSLLSSMTGKIFGAIAEIRDITQRKRMEEVMLRVEKLSSLGELSAGMAHEIRNPLAGIKTSVQVLTKRVTKAESKELLSGIESEINHLNKIVTDLLRFSRPSPPIFEPLDITRILGKTLDLISEKVKAHAITIEQHFSPKIPHVFVDQEQIRQVFLNLLINSIKAMETGGRLTIEVQHADERPNSLAHFQAITDLKLSKYIKVVFADTGRGIEPHYLQKVFDPFFTTDPKGTGLGLAIAHKLIEENNGYIFIDSIKEKGTRAILLLPVAKEETA